MMTIFERNAYDDFLWQQRVQAQDAIRVQAQDAIICREIKYKEIDELNNFDAHVSLDFLHALDFLLMNSFTTRRLLYGFR